MRTYYPFFNSDNEVLNTAFRIAIGDVIGNIVPYKGGVLEKEEFCLLAGLDYQQPWTRDTAINVWNAMCLIDPEVCKNTLKSVLDDSECLKVGGSYGQNWDNVIWALGADAYYQTTHDKEFLEYSYVVNTNTMEFFEKTEFNKELNLFNGRGVYADGIAAYPQNIADKLDIEPVYNLSLNCMFYKIYCIMADNAKRLNKPFAELEQKAVNMKKAIQKHFWNEKNGNYDYFVNESDENEALGLAYVMLYDIATEDQKKLITKNTHITPNGIPCEWPNQERYAVLGEYGRHSGTIWSLCQTFWALACLHVNYNKGFDNELFLLADKAIRDMHFAEMFHPDTGDIYGGWQEWEGNIVKWASCRKQTWSATGFLSLLYRGILGFDVVDGVITLKPYLPDGVNTVTVSHINLLGKTFAVKITRDGSGPKEFKANVNDIKDVIELSF